MKVAVIGGSSGLGFECARRLVEMGHGVHALSRRGTGPAGATAKVFDLATYDGESGPDYPLGALLIAAGMGAFHRPDQLSRRVIEEMVAINLTGVISLMNDAAVRQRNMRVSCRIVAVTSTAGDGPSKGLGVYAACKKGVEGFIRAEGHRHAKRGVHLLAASLPFFDSPMIADLDPLVRKRAEARCPGGRFATLAEAAEFTLSLLLGEAPGGKVARMWPEYFWTSGACAETRATHELA